MGRAKEINVYTNRVNPELDQEWRYLIAEAKKAGLTMKQIRDFLNSKKTIQGIHNAEQKEKYSV